MKNVKINRQELLAIVTQNRDKHVTDYAETLKDFKIAIVNVASKNLELVQTGDLVQIGKVKHLPTVPVTYETEYNRSIRMLELSVDKVIELDEHTFNQLVLDEWSWKNQFTTTAAFYKSMT